VSLQIRTGARYARRNGLGLQTASGNSHAQWIGPAATESRILAGPREEMFVIRRAVFVRMTMQGHPERLLHVFVVVMIERGTHDCRCPQDQREDQRECEGPSRPSTPSHTLDCGRAAYTASNATRAHGSWVSARLAARAREL
jgi:hypothetical protein